MGSSNKKKNAFKILVLVNSVIYIHYHNGTLSGVLYHVEWMRSYHRITRDA